MHSILYSSVSPNFFFKKETRRRHPVKICAMSKANGAKLKFFASLSFKKESRRRPPVI